MSHRLEVLPGPGTVVRHGDVVVWAGPSSSAALLSFLAQSARNVGDSTLGGLQIADHISGILSTRDPEPGAPFAVLGPSPHGWMTLLHGPVQLWDGARWLAPTPNPGWLRSEVTPQPAVSVGPAGGASPRLSPDSPYDLSAGTVPGGGLILMPDPAAAPAAPGRAYREATGPAPGGQGGSSPGEMATGTATSPLPRGPIPTPGAFPSSGPPRPGPFRPGPDGDTTAPAAVPPGAAADGPARSRHRRSGGGSGRPPLDVAPRPAIRPPTGPSDRGGRDPE